MLKARYIMVGGFLGAGKTTAILALAERLVNQGLRVGLITNDQSSGLVDTTLLSARGFAVEEITGGCFCCKFDSLVEAAARLSAQDRPDVFIAEPVGSCTDIKATVDYPLRRLYGDDYSIAPLSVLVDPIRAMRMLGLESGKSFSKKVSYIYLKQLEEAEIIVINKADLLDPDRLSRLHDALRRQFPNAQVDVISARQRTGLAQWLERLEATPARTVGAMDVDYETYADAEARLGWLNLTASVTGAGDFDGNSALLALAADLQDRLRASAIEVAHLKLTLSPDEGNDLAVANLVRSDHVPELSHKLDDVLRRGELIINLRAEAEAPTLKQAATEALAALSQAKAIQTTVRHLDAFSPAKPTPVHRLGGVSQELPAA